MKPLHIHLVSLAVAAAVAAPAFANHPLATPSLGTPLHDARAERVDRAIAIDANTKWVNVTGGETIKFVANGRSFSWLFDTYASSLVFDLDRIAPAGMLGGQRVKVYVAPDPQYIN